MSLRSEKCRSAQQNFHDFCHLPNWLLSSIGYDFPSKPRSIGSMVLRNYFFLLIVSCNVYVFVYMTKSTYGMIVSDEFELSLLLRIISGMNYTLCATVKFLAFVWNKKQRQEIFDTLTEIYPKSRKEKIIYKVWKYFWPKWILRIVYFYLGSCAFIITSPLLESVVLYVANVVGFGWLGAEFGYYKLYDVEYSFDHRNLFAYTITCCIEILHAYFAVIFNISGDIWLLFYTTQLCMHFDYIARTLENYEPNEDEFARDQQFVAAVVRKHQIILNLGDALNKAFGLLILLSLISIAATLCCAGVYTLTQRSGRELIEYLAFLPTAIGQYFIVCYYGQLLISKSASVAWAAYNNPWYNGSHSYKKSIYIILMRSQKEVILNALGFQPICVATFQMVMGATYRIFALSKETML